MLCGNNLFMVRRAFVRAVFCCLLLNLLCGFGTVKDVAYFRENKDEAKELLTAGRCKGYKGQNDIFVGDPECQAAYNALDDNKQAIERDALIEELQKLNEQYSKDVKINTKEKKDRYNKILKLFNNNFQQNEDFLVSCISSDERKSENTLECFGAINAMLNTMEKERDNEAKTLKKEVEYKDYYRQKLRADASQVDELLNGRCKKLFANPWYDQDVTLQDKECNVAMEEKARQNRIKSDGLSKVKEDVKNVSYYVDNPSEAKKKYNECNKKRINNKSCQNSYLALGKIVVNEKKLEEFEVYLRGSLLAAKGTVDDCQKGVEKNSGKCEVAFKVLNENVKLKKDKTVFDRFVKYFTDNYSEAESLFKHRCKDYTSTKGNSIFIEDDECSAVRRVIENKKVSDDKLELIKVLNEYKENVMKNLAQTEGMSRKKYKIFNDYFKKNHNIAQDFVASCVEDENRTQITPLECIAGVDAVLEKLEEAKKEEEAKKSSEAAYKDYYRRYFLDNEKKVNEVLNGRCKIVFSNEWYEYDQDIKDEECEAARGEKRRIDKIARDKEEEKLREVKKDIAYYRKNLEQTKITANDCANGIVDDIHDCEMSFKTLEQIEKEKQDNKKYAEFYKDHILAAKYQMKWCRANMIKLDSHCEVVEEILKNHKDRVEDESLLKDRTDYYTQNPLEAQVTIKTKCADRIGDSWYFLDINLQTEDCDAALEVVKGY